MLIFQTPTSEAFWIVIGAISAFIIGLAAFITALSVIYTKVLKPLRDKWDEKIFKPLEKATKEVMDISQTLNRIESRVFEMEEIYKKHNIEQISYRFEEVALDTAFTLFNLRLQNAYSKKAIFILDENGDCEYVNQTLCELMKTDSSDLEGSNWLKRIVSAERSAVESEWQDAYKRRRKFDMEENVWIGNEATRVRIKVKVEAEPFIYQQKVRKYFGVITKID